MNDAMREGLLLAAALGVALAAAEALTANHSHNNNLTSSNRLENVSPLNPFTTPSGNRASLAKGQ
jgi:hypothetical protein